MLDLLAAIRKLRTALENPIPDPNLPGFVVLPLSQADAKEIDAVFARVLHECLDALPPGVETKLHRLFPVEGSLWFPRDTNDPNRVRRRRLDDVREIEGVITGIANTRPVLVETMPPAPIATGATRNSGDATVSTKWLSLAEAERLSGINQGTISKAVENGELISNGSKGKGKRKVDSADFNRWCLARSEKPQRVETNAEVKRKLRRHTKD
jgi:hypothetical protein